MNVGPEVPEAYVVLRFLTAELNSGRRWKQHVEAGLKRVNTDERLILGADLNSVDENRDRADVLAYRGWKRNQYLFIDFPEDVRWFAVGLTPQDIRDLRYVHDRDGAWTRLSKQTRYVADAVATIREEKIPADDTDVADIASQALSLADAFDSGKERPEIIVVGESEDDALVILEGHMRATAYGLAKTQPAERPAILGLSARMGGWYWR